MISTRDAQAFRHVGRLGRGVAVATVVALAVLAAGCGDKKKDRPASQTAAKVNKEEITVHQINFVLQQQRGIPPEQAQAASKQALERLIDQELAVQKAGELKIDRDPRVVQQIEAARREIIARSYIEKIATGAAEPTAEEVTRYYNDHPARFKERRVYNLQEVLVEASPEQLPELKKQLEAAKDVGAFVAYLKSNNIRHGGNQAMRTPEQLPEAVLARLSAMKDGEALFTPIRSGAQIVFIAGSRPQPVTEAQARPNIEQILVNERKRRLVEDDLKSLRKAAEIEYVGDYGKDVPATEGEPAMAPLTAPSAASAAMEPVSAASDPGVQVGK
jgi:EpsD family peptidyl-prolyl cis-trans isomerase